MWDCPADRLGRDGARAAASVISTGAAGGSRGVSGSQQENAYFLPWVRRWRAIPGAGAAVGGKVSRLGVWHPRPRALPNSPQLAGNGARAKNAKLPDNQLKDKPHKTNNRDAGWRFQVLSPREQKQRKFLSYKQEGQAFQSQTLACVKQKQE